jgi:hypothetical protein
MPSKTLFRACKPLRLDVTFAILIDEVQHWSREHAKLNYYLYVDYKLHIQCMYEVHTYVTPNVVTCVRTIIRPVGTDVSMVPV